MSDSASIEDRVQALLLGARRLANPHDELGKMARRDLPRSTGLSPQNVEAALELCLETRIEPAALARLRESIAPCSRAHVLLPANVFIAPVRAIVLALIASPHVFVRPSRREPCFVDLLARAAPGSFEIVDTLEPSAGDQVWAYGSDATLAELEASLGSGVVLHAHGSGMGIVLVDEADLMQRSEEELAALCDGIALDMALFDQRGCLSPRLVVMRARESGVQRFRQRLERSLRQIEAWIPCGELSAVEQAEVTWYRESLACVGSWFPLPRGGIGIVTDDPELIPPVGRHVQICVVSDLGQAVAEIAPLVTQVAHPPDPTFYQPWLALLPGARVSTPGKMQRPPLDGPVDLRRIAVASRSVNRG